MVQLLASGKTYNFVPYNVDPETELLVLMLFYAAKEVKPKLIVAGALPILILLI